MAAELGGELFRRGRCVASLIVVMGVSGCTDPILVKAPECAVGETRSCTSSCDALTAVQTCGENGWGPCEETGEPGEETCNGRDDDCDGLVDETFPEQGATCGSEVGQCRQGRIVCEGGYLSCAGGHAPETEICNGEDDDCDGEIDEDIDEELCYDGPPETRGVGICHAGVRLCKNGAMVCEGQQVPEPANCMNGLDNDCNGQLDRPATVTKVDVVLLIDKSGSMLFAFEGLRPAVLRFLSAVSGEPEVRVGIVSVPGAQTLSRCTLEAPLGPAEDAIDLVRNMRTDGGGNEPTFDCPMGIAHPARPLGIDWAEGARRVAVMFTDEDCQSAWCVSSCGEAGEPPGSTHWCEQVGFPASHRLGLDETAQMLSGQDIRLEIFTIDALADYYRPLAERTGGELRSLLQPPEELGAEIQSVLMGSVCQ